MTLAEVSLMIFSAFTGLRVFSYLPQIYRVARDTEGAAAISYTTWAIWAGGNISTTVYAAINLSDHVLAVGSGIHAFCCVVVITMTVSKRYRLRLRHQRAEAT